MRLKDKVAIVTGAARGIGFGIAKAFSREGAHVVLADTEAESGKAAAGELDNALFIEADVGYSENINDLVSQTLKNFGRIDICVNNAGILRVADVLDYTEEDFDDVIRTNLKGAFLLSQAAAREMVKNESSGSIINISSINAKVSIPNAVAYNVSKGGINQLTTAMAVALAQRNIRVNAIGPGTIMTDMLKENLMVNDEIRKTILSRTPLGRVGEVDEVANIAVFLASEESSYITGQCIYADGGRLGLNYVVPVIEKTEDDENEDE